MYALKRAILGAEHRAEMQRLGRHLLTTAALGLLLAGGATAAVLATRTITLKPGHCRSVSHSLRVCAAAGGAKGAKTVTSVKTTTETITVAPSPVGKTFGGAGNSTLATFTLSHEATLSWTESQPDSGGDCFEVDDQTGSDLADNGLDCSVGAGTTTLQPGTYTLSVVADAPWTISF